MGQSNAHPTNDGGERMAFFGYETRPNDGMQGLMCMNSSCAKCLEFFHFLSQNNCQRECHNAHRAVLAVPFINPRQHRQNKTRSICTIHK